MIKNYMTKSPKTAKNLILSGVLFSMIFLPTISCTTTNTTKTAKNTKTTTPTEIKDKITVTVDFNAEKKQISPYIFGINDGADLLRVQPKSIRLGGNRMTAYNWETNISNAGSDWYNSSDDYLVNKISAYKSLPGGPALFVAQNAEVYNIPYTLLTLQMAGYVAKKNGNMTLENELDGPDWCKVINRKNGDFLLKPEKTDNVVYTDEYLNYLENMIGKSDSITGFKGYALDNEPALWQHTHSLIQRKPLLTEDFMAKSIDLAATVKDFDPNADVFGPCLFGYSAYCALGANWKSIELNSLFRYQWFIDYYLDKMKEAEEQYGKRLLDVLDLHYYTEAKGACGKRTCNHYDNDDCIKARINSVRSLYDENYKERSWIQDTGALFFPLIPKIQESIDKFYPGTKIGFSEYNFGGGDHISGAIAQTDFLGLLAQKEVYFATIWAFDNAEYQFEAINMFTNYDYNGSSFGDTLIASTTSDDYTVSSFVAENQTDGKLHIILTNKAIHTATKVTINIGENKPKSCDLFILDDSSDKIHKSDSKITTKKGQVTIVLEPLSVNHLVLEIENKG